MGDILPAGSATQSNRFQPVYNATFTPTVPTEPDHLFDGQNTLLRFFIGPLNSSNVLTATSRPVDSRILNAAEDVPLTITMTCRLCVGRGNTSSIQVKRIVYHAATGTSTEARFHIIPKRDLAKQEVGSNEILIEIRNSKTAVRYGSLAIVANMNIEQGSERAPSHNVEPGGFSPYVSDKRTFRPDLIITIRPQAQQLFDVGFEAINPELVRQLQGLEFSKKLESGIRQLRFFPTGDFTGRELTSFEGAAAATLKGITDQENVDLKNALTASPNGSVDLDTVDFITLSESDEEKILDSFYLLGHYIYSRLFYGDPDLKRLIHKVEAFTASDGHTLRILIRTSGVAFPWQLLNDPASTDSRGQNLPGAFWGFKYEIAVDSLARLSVGTVVKNSPLSPDSVSLFGTYQGEDYPVQFSAQQQSAYFTNKVHPRNALTASSVSSFLKTLKESGDSLDFILVYTHGSNGYVNEVVNGNNVLLTLNPPGQRLIFSQSGIDFLRATDLMNLAIHADEQKGPFFQRNPLVLLNACETGIFSSNELTLPESLLLLGARGVIATEAPVPNKFALRFGDDLIDQMAQGKDMASAIRDVREAYFSKGNPLGLIYSYYSYDGIASSIVDP